MTLTSSKPEILAPAGSKAAFMAALAAGADAVYCGLKQFSARMAAENFSPSELARLVTLAHQQGTAVYVAVNSLVRPGELERVRELVRLLSRHIRPDALIIQDLALVELARQEEFAGELHLSTLSAATFAAALQTAAKLPGVSRVVLPRELNIDEIRQVAAACPDSLDLELFVHGALCYGVSGRCYWSSYLGGKSGLRGRCVQPCRRQYTVGETQARFFSCLDFSADVLVKPLREIPAIAAWKIEGRKKGPHYVYHTVSAYRLLRDEGRDPAAKKAALEYLQHALGRRTTHYLFLPQRQYPPANSGEETGSGRFAGRVKGSGREVVLRPRLALLKSDILRIGYEDQKGHHIHKVGKYVPRQGRLHLRLPPARQVERGAPVFLVDRLSPELAQRIAAGKAELEAIPPVNLPAADRETPPSSGAGRMRGRPPRQGKVRQMDVFRRLPVKGGGPRERGLWLSAEIGEHLNRSRAASRYWLWLPPVIWPEEEADMRQRIEQAVARGHRRFVLNAPWQTALFPAGKNLQWWAGPFCNAANPLAVKALAAMGFSGVIVSPELPAADLLILPSSCPLPLGLVVSGFWPLCLARTKPADFPEDQLFTSPRGEGAWVSRRDSCWWVFPNWPLDITARQNRLVASGYRLLVQLAEPLPERITVKKRPGLWNWEAGLT
ncbi:MAG: peptidase U32 family protein [Desulfosudaceae bacterium]